MPPKGLEIELLQETAVKPEIVEDTLRLSQLGFSAGDQIKTPEGENARILGVDGTDRNKVYYQVDSEEEPRSFIARNKQQAKERVILVRPVSAQRAKGPKKGVSSQEKEKDEFEQISKDVIRYKTGPGYQYYINTSEQAFEDFKQRYTFNIGDTIKIRGYGAVILGIEEDNENYIIVKYSDSTRNVDGFESFEIDDGDLRDFLRENNENQSKTTSENIVEYKSSTTNAIYRAITSPEVFADFKSKYTFDIDDVLTINGQEARILGIYEEDTDAVLIKYLKEPYPEYGKDGFETINPLANSIDKKALEPYLRTEDAPLKEQQKENTKDTSFEQISDDVRRYEDGTDTYDVNTSEERFRTFKELYTFKVGDTIKVRGEDEAVVLGTDDDDNEYILVKYTNPNLGFDRFYEEAALLADYFRKDENGIVYRQLSDNENIREYDEDYDIDISPRAFELISESYDLKVGATVTIKSREAIILGTSVNDNKAFFVKYKDRNNKDRNNYEQFDISLSADREILKPYLRKDTNLPNRESSTETRVEQESGNSDNTNYEVIGADQETEDEFGTYLKEKSYLKHKEAMIAKADRLKNSNAFQALAELIAHDPNLKEEYRMMTDRLKEYKDHRSPEERHRTYTAMMAGIMMSPRLSRMLDLTIDDTIRKESTQMKEEAKERENYTYEVVAGSGVHGTIYNINRQMYFPEHPSLTVDQSQKIGGQFGKYQGDAFRLNSRTRKHRPGEEYLPGTRQTLNTFTEFATMQPSDTTGMTYSYQTALSKNMRANFFLSGKAMTGAELYRVRKNSSDTAGDMTLEMIDKDTNTIFTLNTDRLILPSGLGKELTRLDETDLRTKSILEEEEEKFQNGEDAQVMSFTQFVERMADNTNPFPQKGMQRIIMSGKGDSGAVIAGMLLGYEAQYGKSTIQLDTIEEVIWLGQDLPTKEAFVKAVRTRYAQVGLEFPREEIENYYSRIRPVTARSELLSREGSDIVVVDDAGTKHKGDHFIYAHGFEDNTDKVAGGYFDTVVTDKSEITKLIEEKDIFAKEGNTVFYSSGRIRQVEVIKREGLVATFRLVDSDGIYTEETYFLNKLPEAFSRRYLNLNTIATVSIPQEVRTVNVYGENENSAIATQYRSLRGPTAEIYKAGPASKLALSDEERQKSPALQKIKENTAAVFRYANNTAALARKLAKQDKENNIEEKLEGSLPEKIEKPAKVDATSLFSPSKRTKEPTVLYATPLEKENEEQIGYEENLNDLGRFAIGQFFEKYTFREDKPDFEITIIKTRFDKDYIVEVNPQINNLVIFEDLLQDELVAPVIRRLTDVKNNITEKIIINIPLQKGKVDITNITTRIPRAEVETKSKSLFSRSNRPW